MYNISPNLHHEHFLTKDMGLPMCLYLYLKEFETIGGSPLTCHIIRECDILRDLNAVYGQKKKSKETVGFNASFQPFTGHAE